MAKLIKKEKACYSVIRPFVFKGERVDVGTILELSNDDLKNINRAYVEETNPVKEEAKKEEVKKEELKKQEGKDIDI